ncbi:hypothetical protein ABIF63_004884 [Bradyrhizobium japonicum]|uniref:RiboL-PSP-HEPN domain-containing protein n=1 Tax=Bradyrhizobium japonicum TaxID=375 RepID=A0ABV2RV14_BRAJP|nr:hypothetical protein [Bradyrhizobium japonicum]UQD96005.1 hypothetical protein JEY30_31150 [Bradyrhizobium japonicum]WLB16142.1 hypothetical protein QIH95_29355 [Bradyrhizobium japonicum]
MNVTVEDDLYARTSPALLAMHACERAATEYAAAMSGETERWFFAITDMHQALTAALVETLSGTAGIGALPKKLQKEWLGYFDARNDTDIEPPIEDRVITFGELLDRARDATHVHDMQGTLALSEDEKRDLLRLNEFRNDLAHVKPRGWSLEIAGLPRIFGVAAKAARQLFNMAPLRLHLEDHQIERAEMAIDTIAHRQER